MMAAYRLPTEWAKEMLTVDDFLKEKAKSGQKKKQQEFIGENIFLLKIMNPARNDVNANNFYGI